MSVNQEEDLEALFDQISEQRAVTTTETPVAAEAAQASSSAVAEGEEGDGEAYDIFNRIGHLTRSLHDALRELCYDKSVETAVHSLPDAQDRLAYIANLTGKAAETTLSCVEKGQTEQDVLQAKSDKLAADWDKLFAGHLSVDDFKKLAHESRDFMKVVNGSAQKTSGLFTEIMMAQDFHDLTGQMINKIVKIAKTLEDQLVHLLLDASPPEKRSDDFGLEGPIHNHHERDDVVANQSQVDDLLESLGF